jgi:hypothetical protein
MEISAFSSRPNEFLIEAQAEASPDTCAFLAGQQVRIMYGRLAGLRGKTHGQAADGRWIITLDDAAHGVFLCIDPRQLVIG